MRLDPGERFARDCMQLTILLCWFLLTVNFLFFHDDSERRSFFSLILLACKIERVWGNASVKFLPPPPFTKGPELRVILSYQLLNIYLRYVHTWYLKWKQLPSKGLTK